MEDMSHTECCCSPATSQSPPPLEDTDAAYIAKALAHPARLRILRILGGREECYCGDLCDELPLAQSTVSQHLKVLREAGLIRGTACGPAVCYCVEPKRLEAFHAWAADLAHAPAAGTVGVPG